MIRRTPSRFSIRAVERFSVSVMAPRAAFRVFLPKRRMIRLTAGTPSRTIRVRRQSIKAIDAMTAIRVRVCWV
ncbi:hypothetical protein D3C81_1855890 [compost metagenome]